MDWNEASSRLLANGYKHYGFGIGEQAAYLSADSQRILSAKDA